MTTTDRAGTTRPAAAAAAEATGTAAVTTPEEALAAVRRLAPEITARAPEIEAARRVPRDLLDAVARAGGYRLLLPRSHGGLGADPVGAFRVYEALAAADASLAWVVLIGGGGWLDLTGLPPATFDELFGRGDTRMAGVFRPSGSATPVGGGYRIDGRWTFASGCEDADRLYVNCLEGVVDGEPQLRIAVLHPDDVTIVDNWRVLGLRGTGSHDLVVDGVVVPAERTSVPLHEASSLDDPIVRIPLPSLLSLGLAGVAAGVARGALDDVVGLATEKTPLFEPGALAGNALFRHDLAAARTTLRAIRALLEETAGTLWSAAVAGNEPRPTDVADARATAAWATARAAEVVAVAYRHGGSTSVGDASPLQRRFRDVHAITQHFLLKPDTLTAAGAVLTGADPGVPIF